MGRGVRALAGAVNGHQLLSALLPGACDVWRHSRYRGQGHRTYERKPIRLDLERRAEQTQKVPAGELFGG